MPVERTYTIPLRRDWLKAPMYKRAKRSVSGIKSFLSRHMKQPEFSMIKLGSKLNETVWARGIKNPPHKVKVTVVKEDDGLVKAELFGHKYIVKTKPEKEEDEGGIAGKLKGALGTKEKGKEAEQEESAEKKEPEEPGVKEGKAKEEKTGKDEGEKKEAEDTETKGAAGKKGEDKESRKKSPEGTDKTAKDAGKESKTAESKSAAKTSGK
ncbi:MAG: 50S ribosomal protein L31e [Candidatus Woesearchaeota archaeon]